MGLVATALLRPALPNGDGLGYLRATQSTELALFPGHLLWVPLLRGLRALLPIGHHPADMLVPAQLLSNVATGITLAFFYLTARVLEVSRAAATIATIGLAASYAVLRAGSDVEVYALALAAISFATYASIRAREGGRAWFVIAAVAAAATALVHVENLVFIVPCALWLSGRRRYVFAVVAFGLVGLAYLVPILAHGPRWLLLSTHGFPSPMSWYQPFVALYGAAKAFLFAPYPYEASPRVFRTFTALGLLTLAWLSQFLRRERVPLWVILSWVTPYTLVGIRFYGSDDERWIFLLPLFWLCAADAFARARTRFAVLGIMLVCNALVLGKLAWAKPAPEVSQLDALVTPSDLVLAPGHSWDEYIGFTTRKDVHEMLLVYYAGAVLAHDREERIVKLRALIAPEVAATLEQHGRIYLVRFEDTRDPMGYKELARMQIFRSDLLSLLPPGERVRVTDTVELFVPRN